MLYFFLLILSALLFFPDVASAAAADALRLCGTAVIPALFPFFLLTRLLSAYLPTPKKGSAHLPALVISFLGGYPVGISTVVSLYENGQLSKSEAESALRICNNSGPGFFMAVLGGKVLQSASMGLALYLIHVLSALLCASLWPQAQKKRLTLHRLQKKLPFPQQFQQALSAACTAMLQVCGLVIVFSVVPAFLRLLVPHGVMPFVKGAMELTGGVLSLQGHPHAFVLCALFMGWGGLCVHLQAMSLWQAANLQCRGYFLHKLLHALVSALLAYAAERRRTLLFLLIPLFFLLFSQIRKKWGGKKAALAV